jgi:hypothetical protein
MTDIFINLNFGAMKKIGIILLLTMVTLVSCSKDDDENVVNPLIGTWENSLTYDGVIFKNVYTFNANNTGVLSIIVSFQGEDPETYTENFNWSINNNNNLTLLIGGEMEVVNYSISGNKLTITFEGETIVFTRL